MKTKQLPSCIISEDEVVMTALERNMYGEIKQSTSNNRYN